MDKPDNFPFSQEIWDKIEKYQDMMSNAQINEKGLMIHTPEMREINQELVPYVLSDVYMKYQTEEYAKIGIGFRYERTED